MRYISNSKEKPFIDLDKLIAVRHNLDLRRIECACKDEGLFELTFDSSKDREKEYIYLESYLKSHKNKGGAMQELKEYFKKHQESIISFGLLLLIDEYIFEGKFRERIKNIIERIFTKTEKKLLRDEANHE